MSRQRRPFAVAARTPCDERHTMFAPTLMYSLPQMGPALWAAIIIVALALLFALAGLRRVPNNRVGIVEKRFALAGSVRSGFIALSGEAGYQPHLLRGGLHWLMP